MDVPNGQVSLTRAGEKLASSLSRYTCKVIAGGRQPDGADYNFRRATAGGRGL